MHLFEQDEMTFTLRVLLLQTIHRIFLYNSIFSFKFVIYGKYTMLDFSFTVRIQYVKSDALIRRPGHERFGSSHIQLKL